MCLDLPLKSLGQGNFPRIAIIGDIPFEAEVQDFQSSRPPCLRLGEHKPRSLRHNGKISLFQGVQEGKAAAMPCCLWVGPERFLNVKKN
jgi:hypothetical protein